ncbi:Integral membrane protein sed5 [Mycena sanguinolenta]|uniref:Integral membrane protein sed5 n=1 Tax=Mycena sanguinolenta TaxID=230812 RepID=A0A8H6XEU4_9AGAR|nr:Integral membrane protein sed5 [Mycena sanguinolenta]
MSPLQDRTNEFRSCVESIRSRSAGPRADAKQRLLRNGKTSTKSEFSRMASTIGKDISSTTIKLGKLAQLAKRKTLFDDRPVEISELTFIIKQDIANINKQIAALQAYVKQRNAQGSKSAEGKQLEEHNHNVVMLLQSKLANTSMTFKDVLEVRTQNMKESRNRTEQFMYSTANATQSASSSMLYNSRPDPMGDGTPNGLNPKGKRDGHRRTATSWLWTSIPQRRVWGVHNVALSSKCNWWSSRSVHSKMLRNIAPYAGDHIFTQLANMVAEQRETVQRIDADTLDIAANVGGGTARVAQFLIFVLVS